MRSAVVTAYPRIHITLVDLANGTGRRYGGAGFALDGLTTTATAKRAERGKFSGPAHFEPGDVADVREAVNRLSARLGLTFDVNVNCDAPSHSGFGTKTTGVLAALTACNAVVGAGLGARELVSLARRGGTSGIGVNTAFVGGFIADAGHPADSATPLLPSSLGEGPHLIPPAIVKLSVPEKWCVHLFLPEGRRVNAQIERDFFACNTPIPRWEVLEVLASVYHGIIPAFASASLVELTSSLQRVHELGFKKREVEYQGGSVLALLRFLKDVGGVAAGMSSLGPLVYGIAENDSSGEQRALFESEHEGSYLGQFKPRNLGNRVLLSGDD